MACGLLNFGNFWNAIFEENPEDTANLLSTDKSSTEKKSFKNGPDWKAGQDT